MLASPAEDHLIQWPVLASAKLDGVRAVVRDGVVLSRALKPIPNKNVQKRFSHLEHFDGELIVGASNDPDVLRTTTSGVMRVDGDPEVSFHVFDHIQEPTDPYLSRLQLVKDRPRKGGSVLIVDQTIVQKLGQLNEYEPSILAQGYEGVMLRRRTIQVRSQHGARVLLAEGKALP